MPWEIEITDEFEEWWYGLTPTQKFAVDERVELLERDGPQQGEPYVKRIKQSRLHNLKELRCNEEGSLRIRSPSTHAGFASSCWEGTRPVIGRNGTPRISLPLKPFMINTSAN